jgi:YfiH family protein
MSPVCILPDWPAPSHVNALLTTRSGGSSEGVYSSMNLGLHVGDDPYAVLQNRQLLEKHMGVHPVFLDQVHGTDIVSVEGHTPNGCKADGAFTTVKNVACTVMVADCLPVLICNTQGSHVAAVHAGWRGLVGGVLESAFKALAPLDHSELLVWLGPCIGPQAFEVGDDVRSAFLAVTDDAERHFTPTQNDKWLANLSGLTRQRLQANGIHAIYGNDGSPSWCTVGNASTFFSHRRDRVSGRQAACIWLV